MSETRSLQKIPDKFGPHFEPQERTEAIELWDRKNPGSVISMVPAAVARKFQAALDGEPVAFKLDEQDLAKCLRKNKCSPTATDNRLRLNFWMEYDRCKGLGLPTMTMEHVFANICTEEFFNHHYLTSHTRVAWLLCPPVGYSRKLAECLDYSLDQLRDILSLSIYKKDDQGNETEDIDLNLCKLKAGIHKMLDDRKNGLGTIKVEKKSLSLTGKVSDIDRKLISEMAEGQTEEELKIRLQKVMKAEREALHIPMDAEVVDVSKKEDPIEP